MIVESPAKAKTIEKFLGKDFVVKSSFGHIRDLSKKDISVDIENNFEPNYQVPSDKQKIVLELKKDASAAEVVWLASDEDREGEAIAWHLKEALNLDEVKIKRIVFNEITKTAILKAVENPRKIDIDLVNAQQARRVLDRIVGYEISPILWRKVKPSLSAGRVQSVAVRLIVERENEIRSFIPTSSFKITAEFKVPSSTKLLSSTLNKRFDKKDDVLEFLKDCIGAIFTVNSVEKKPSKQTPAPPFTTSTLQQEASRKFGFPVSKTMLVAQQLYEAGHITYMRTDSVNLSQMALSLAKTEIETTFGQEYVKTRQYSTKSKGAQEAHEAIRPTYMQNKTIEGDASAKRLYELIWKRTIASQMADAKLEKTTINIDISTRKENFIAQGEIIIFDGFLKVYSVSKDDDEENEELSSKLPDLKKGDNLSLVDSIAKQTYTLQPPRYNEATLVKKLEDLGIGRPSTYAPTISTIQAREYVSKTEDNKLIPTQTGEIVNSFLVDHFSNIVDLGFTAKIEEEFDEIAEGKIAWEEVMKNFYGGFKKTIDEKESSVSKEDYLQVNELGIDPKSGKPVSARVGRFGPFVQIGTKDDEEKPKFVAIPDNLNMDTITLEEALFLFNLPRVVGNTQNGDEIKANIGRFGPYLQVKTKYYSLKTDDPYTIDLNRALEIIKDIDEAKEKSTIKTFDKEKIQILVGQYGPYIKQGRKNFKIPKGKNAEDLTLEECLEIIEKDSKGSTKRTTTKKSTTEKKTTAKKTTKKSTDKK